MNPTLTIRITVRDRLSEHLAAAFDGMTLRRCGGVTNVKSPDNAKENPYVH
jgi:hypothetical protein